MRKGEFIFSCKRASQVCPGREYEQAYASTNEPLDWETDLVNPRHKSVLTVAASGDQPIIYATRNSAHIDTFDITCYANVIMDFKTTSLDILTYNEYSRIIPWISVNLRSAAQRSEFKRVFSMMPAETHHILDQILKTKNHALIFGREPVYKIDVPRDATHYLSMQMQSRRRYDFIWADVKNLHEYLTRPYDIINTSNIFDHYFGQCDEPHKHIAETVKNLWPYLNKGGHIISTSTAHRTDAQFRTLKPFLAENAIIERHGPKNNFYATVIQKVR